MNPTCATYYFNQRKIDLCEQTGGQAVNPDVICYRETDAAGVQQREGNFRIASWRNRVVDLTGCIICEQSQGGYACEIGEPKCEWEVGNNRVYLFFSKTQQKLIYQLFAAAVRNTVHQGYFDDLDAANMELERKIALCKNLSVKVIDKTPRLEMPWYWRGNGSHIEREAQWTVQANMDLGDQQPLRNVTLRLLSIGSSWIWEAVLVEERFASRLPVHQEKLSIFLPADERIQSLIESSIQVNLDKYGRLTSVKSAEVIEKSRIDKTKCIDRLLWAVTAVKRSNGTGLDPRSFGHLAIMIESVEKWKEGSACYRRQLADIRVEEECPEGTCKVKLGDIDGDQWGATASNTFLVPRRRVEEMLWDIRAQQNSYQPYHQRSNNCATWVVQRFDILGLKFKDTIKNFFGSLSTPGNTVNNFAQVSLPQKPWGSVFGKADWSRYFGDVGIEPPLPVDIKEIWEGPCPIWPGRQVKDTHMLVLVPETVNGKPFTLDYLGELIQRPRGGGQETKYRHHWIAGNTPAPKSHWVLMTRDVLDGTRGKEYSDQQAIIAQYRGYDVPRILEAATAILMEHVKTGNRLYSDSPMTWTCCQEGSRLGHQLVVGGFAPGGLHVNHFSYWVDDVFLGLAALRRFS